MKKFVVLLVVVALTCVSSLAFAAAEVTVGGEVAVRSRAFDNMDMNESKTDASGTAHTDTQERWKIDINAKAGDVKGKIQLWNDFESWADNVAPAPNVFETQPGTVISDATTTNPKTSYERSTIGIREAWINFPLGPVSVTAGHQLITIGNGWFFRSNHYGSDAWVVSTKAGAANLAFMDVKMKENNPQTSDDEDLYAVVGTFKLTDGLTLGANFSNVVDRSGTAQTNLQNVGVTLNGKVGPVALKASADFQAGEIDNTTGTDPKFKGNNFVVQGSMPVGPLGVNLTFAQGSGEDAGTDIKLFQNYLDIDPHYTFLYEYKMNTVVGRKNTGFANTTALGIGATFKATNSLSIGADFWMLTATEAVTAKVGTGKSDDIGQEIDVKVNWKVAENLNWNWVYGVFMPGDAMGKDDATGLQGILSFTF